MAGGLAVTCCELAAAPAVRQVVSDNAHCFFIQCVAMHKGSCGTNHLVIDCLTLCGQQCFPR
jgi:hypothetical protein